MGESNKKRRLSEGVAKKEDPPTRLENTAGENSPSQTVDSKHRRPRRELFVRSLAPSVTSEKLAEYFSQSYIVKHAVVVSDPKSKQHRGYGFVTFADVEDAQGALEELNRTELDGKTIKVVYAEPRQREIDEKLGKSVPLPSAANQKLREEKEQRRAAAQPPKLIVRNLPWSIQESEHLAALFRSFGKVKQATLPKRGTKLAGFGFVVLRGKKNAEKALEAVNGKEVHGRTLAVDWAVDKETWERQKNSTLEEAPSQEGESAESQESESDADQESNSSENDSDEEEPMEDTESEEQDEEEEEEEEDEDEDEEDERNASTIFIRNLPFTCSDEMLHDHFTQFGRLRYARVVVDPETERPRGTGFVCFVDTGDAVSCVRNAPTQTNPADGGKDKKEKGSVSRKQSVLQNETADSTGRYTLDGRVLQVVRAVSRKEATKLEEEGITRRLGRDKDKRRLFLLSEGTVPSNSPLYKKLSSSEIKMREDSFKQRQDFIRKNPTLHISLTRLAIRNIPRHVSSKDLKTLARKAVVGFAQDANAGIRQPLSKEELKRSTDEMKDEDKHRKLKRKGIVKQAKIVFESREGSKISEQSGAGRSRGYGFIEYYGHRHALMGLRWLNGREIKAPVASTTDSGDTTEKKKRLIVEFAIENAQVVKRRNEQQMKMRNFSKAEKEDTRKNDSTSTEKTASAGETGKKRKRIEAAGSNEKKANGGGKTEEENKIAKRNRIISKKQMQRQTRKAKA